MSDIKDTPSVEITSEVDSGEKSTLPPSPQLTPEQERKVWRKIDLRLLPILTLMYLVAFLDRGNIGNAKLEGLITQLHLTGDKFNIALTTFFISYCLFECPSNLVLKKFRPSRWLPALTMLWGLIAMLMGFVKTYHQLVGVRFCLGIAESGLFPGVTYFLSLWYPRHMLQTRIGFFFGAASLSGAFSGLLAYGISFMSGVGGYLGWSWIFILEGMATILVGFAALFILVDLPETAGFLTPEERAFVIHKKKFDNSSVGEEEHFEMRHFWAAALDWQVWLHVLIYLSIATPIFGVALFLPFGYSTAVSQLLTVPPYLTATIVLYVWAYYSDKLKMRSPFICLGYICLLVGYSISISNANNGAKYFATFCIATGAYASFPGVVSWLSNNLSGHYKRGIGMAIQIGLGNFSGAIASNIYRAQDGPRYVLGHALELMFVGIGVICVPIAVLIYTSINKRRDKKIQEALERGEKLTPEEIRRLGDRSPDFRYTI
ncbi:hypothetical protein AX15_001665 [Amanita polypyramis BW_CC]|nr:hypothetical protein AX15_001665 [Amanita polypyramis BW_CC]